MKIPFEIIDSWVKNGSIRYDAHELENNVQSYYTGCHARYFGVLTLTLGVIAFVSVMTDRAKLQGMDYLFILITTTLFVLSRCLWRLTSSQKIIVEEFLKDIKNLRKLGRMRFDKKFANCMEPHWQLDKEFPQPPYQEVISFHSGEKTDAANTNCAFYCWSAVRRMAMKIILLETEQSVVLELGKNTESVVADTTLKLKSLRTQLEQAVELMTKFKLFRKKYRNKAQCFEKTGPGGIW